MSNLWDGKNIVAGQLKASKNLCDCGNENVLNVSETALHSGLKKTCGHAEDIKVSSDKKCEELSRNTKFISLAEKYPELAKEWNTVRNDKLSPENVASGSFDFDSKKG